MDKVAACNCRVYRCFSPVLLFCVILVLTTVFILPPKNLNHSQPAENSLIQRVDLSQQRQDPTVLSAFRSAEGTVECDALDAHSTDCAGTLDKRYIEVEYRGEGKHWQAQRFVTTSDEAERVYGMHAYYDDRPALKDSVYIRLFVVVTRTSVTSMLRASYCHLWTQCSTKPIVVRASIIATNTGREIKVQGKYFYNFILSCEVPDTLVLNNITISHASFVPHKCRNSTVYIPVTYPVKPKTTEHMFGMCEANGVSFGYLGPEDALWLVEWFEANRLFGVSEFNVYNSTMQVCEAVKRVLIYYQDMGLLRLHQQHPPLHNYSSTDRDVADIAMRTALNDCMYRNMYRYQYTLTIDLDEIMVPTHFTNYSQLFTKLEQNNTRPDTNTFTVQALAFFRTFLGNTDEKLDSESPMRTASYLNAVKDTRKKTFFNPRLCLGAFSHQCFVPLNSMTAEKIDIKEMAVHHYRDQCIKYADPHKFGPTDCKNKQMQKQLVSRMLDFQDTLLAKVNSVSEQINIKLSLK